VGSACLRLPVFQNLHTLQHDNQINNSICSIAYLGHPHNPDLMLAPYISLDYGCEAAFVISHNFGTERLYILCVRQD
jgi:hypothetical protein